jgi:hypothetical protein
MWGLMLIIGVDFVYWWLVFIGFDGSHQLDGVLF